jgi:hypothetical protein
MYKTQHDSAFKDYVHSSYFNSYPKAPPLIHKMGGGGVFSYAAWGKLSQCHAHSCSNVKDEGTTGEGERRQKSKNINKVISRKLIQFVSSTSTASATLPT